MKLTSSRPCNKALRINPNDTVAVVVEGGKAGLIKLVSRTDEEFAIELTNPIAIGHKVAICAHRKGEPIVKYGVQIGHATQPIKPGDWVHLHNCASDVDARSNEFDALTGVPADTRYE